jgi:signal transduction histidine kinase
VTRSIALVSVAISREHDLVIVRQRARDIARLLGLADSDVTRVTTAVSEVSRNAYEYANGGRVSFTIEDFGGETRQQALCIRVVDEGPGIPPQAASPDGGYRSTTGMGIGISGSRALMDRVEITANGSRGSIVTLAKLLAVGRRLAAEDAGRLAASLAAASEASPYGELQVQNQALLQTLEELTRRQAEIERLSVLATDARARAEAAQQLAERSMVVRERFMALTTHELRTPLGAMISYLELLEMESPVGQGEKPAMYLKRARQACAHLMAITNDFLDMAQGDAGRLSVAHHAGAARHVMSEAFTLVAPQAAARGVNVSLVETTAKVMYLGDVDRIRQILVNILGNAVSFSPRGGIVEVVASNVDYSPPGVPESSGSWMTICVTDSGPGIPADKLSHVFEPFVQLSTDGQSSRKGSGLGLTVSRQLAVLMGGDLTASSTAVGAAFTLWLARGVSKPVRSRAERARPSAEV